MKKIFSLKKINSNFYAGKVIMVILLFLVVAPAFFYLFNLRILFFISISLGGILLLISFLLLVFELHQDKIRDKHFMKYQRTKILLEDGFYECQNCGNRKVQKQENSCSICGAKFIQKSEKTPFR